MPIEPVHYQVVAAVLFAIGLATVASRRNLFLSLMGIELMLNAVNLSFVAFAPTFAVGDADLWGRMTPIFIIAIAAAEACVGLAMVICLVRVQDTVDADARASMKE
jgi:NADH:ubiquinone oxidoreductase subunit K